MINKSLYLALLMLGVFSCYAIDVRAENPDEVVGEERISSSDSDREENGGDGALPAVTTKWGVSVNDENAEKNERSQIEQENASREEEVPGNLEAQDEESETSDSTAEAETPESVASIALAENEEAQAEQLADQANEEEDKSMESLQSALEDIGDNPTPEQAKQLTQAVTTYVESAKKAEIAENARDEVKKRVLSIKIEKGQSSNAPLEPGF